MHIDGEQAWKIYTEIDSVLEKRYNLTKKHDEHSSVDMALQRLGEAIRSSYQLDPEKHRVRHHWCLQLEHRKSLDLSSEEKMLDAHVIQWESAIGSVQVGHDVWTDERTEAFRPQKSLNEALKEDYATIKKILNTTLNDAQKLFAKIKSVVQIELDRLAKDIESDEKINEINDSLQILETAITYKFTGQVKDVNLLSKFQQTVVDSIDFYSFSSLLNARINGQSLKQALNLSTQSLTSKVFGLSRALWGKTTSLENVEIALGIAVKD